MATIVNDRDIQLESISPRVAGVTLNANVTVTQAQVDGLGLVLAGTRSLSLSSTTQVIQVQHDGTTFPTSVTLTANIQNLTETPTLTIVSGSGTMSVTPALTAGVFSFTPAQLTSDSVTLRVQIVDAGTTYEDDVTILKVYEGSDGLAAILTNENVTLSADYLGNVGSYTGAGGQFKVYHGIDDVTSVCTFSIPTGGNPDSLTTSINASGGSAGAYSVTAGFPTTHDFTSVTYRATFGTTTIDKVFTISKAKAGTNGGSGSNTATVYLFQRTATSTPPSVPSGTVTYTFASGATSGVDNGWTQSMSTTGGSYRWITQATALSTGATDTIATTEWATPAILAQDGSNGLNNALVFLYQRSTSSPSVPSATVTYTFASGVATGVNNGWTQTIPTGTNPIYVTVSTAVGSGATDTIATGEWATPVIMAQNGTNGTNGTIGSNGTRGSVTLYVGLTGTLNTWSDSTAASGVTTYTGTAPIPLDVVTEYNNSQSFSVTKFFDGTNWQTVNAFINGNLLVSGTVGASAFVANAITSDKIDTRGMTIKDSSGNVIFGSGTIIGNDAATSLGFNPTFANWTGTYPANWSTWGGVAPTKDTAHVMDGATYSVQYNLSSSDSGMVYAYSYPTSAPLSAGSYLKGSFSLYMLFNAGGGPPGYLVRLFTNSALTTYVDTICPIPNQTVGGWQRYPFTAAAGGVAIYGIKIFQMAGWSGFPGGSGASGNSMSFGPFTFDIYNPVDAAQVNAASNWLNGNISINSNGTLNGAGGGGVTIGGLDSTVLRLANPITSGNVSTYIAAAAISYAQIAYVNANQVNASSLSAITATIGTLRTATSGQRVEITDNLITVYDSSNTIRVKIGNLA